MKYTRYTTIPLKELKPNICHCGCFCELRQRLGCEKKKECLRQLCGSSEKALANVSQFAKYTDKIDRKIDKAVDKWRKEEYKKCKPVYYEITK